MVYGPIVKCGEIIYFLVAVIVLNQSVTFQYGSKLGRKLPEVSDPAPVWDYSV